MIENVTDQFKKTLNQTELERATNENTPAKQIIQRTINGKSKKQHRKSKEIRILNTAMANPFSSNSNAEQISAGKPVLGGRGFSPNWQDFKRSWSNIYWNCGLQLEIRSILGPGPQHTWVNNSGRCLGTQVCCQCVRVSIL